jgi:hypothetical protein
MARKTSGYDAPMRKYPFTDSQIEKADSRLKRIGILSRANLFANDKDLNR